VFATFAAVVPAMILWGRCSRHRAEEIDPATPEQAFAIGGQIILVDGFDPQGEGDDESWRRVTSVDVKTGEITGRHIEELDDAACWPAGERLACRFDTAQLYDARTLAPVAGAAGDQPSEEDSYCAEETSVPGWELAGPEDQRVVRRVHDDVRPTAPRWGYPGFLADSVGGAQVSLDGDPVIVSGTHVARIDAREDAVWDVDLGGGCLAATLADGALVIASDRPHQRVVAIDLATGAIRWTAGY